MMTQNLSALDRPGGYDVCIVGSGPAGTLLGTTLASRGVHTLILESGTGLASWLTNQRLKSLAEYEYTGDTLYPFNRTTSRILGGNSNFGLAAAKGCTPRTSSPTPTRPPTTPGRSITPTLIRITTRPEILRVRGGPRTQFSPPRRHSLPLPGSPDISFLQKLCARFGVEVEDTATATPTRTIRLFNVQKEILPTFLRSGFGTVITGATVLRLTADPDRRISAAQVATLDGQRGIARARLFVICCGGFGRRACCCCRLPKPFRMA